MKRSLGEKIFGVFNILLLTVLCVVMLYPYLNQIAISLNDTKDTLRGGITIFPRVFTLRNYETVLQTKALAIGAKNSIFRLAVGTVFNLSVTTMCAYVLTKKRMPGRKAMLTFLLIPTFIGGGVIPTFILYRYIHILNTVWVYILPHSFNFFYMLIVREYLETIPASLEESAFLDGANEAQILTKIYLPIAKPVMATVGLWVAVWHWGDWTTSLYYANIEKLQTLQYVLMKIIRESEAAIQMQADITTSADQVVDAYVPTPQTIQAAMLVIVTLPIICLYPFLQRYFVTGITLGSVKE